MADAEQDREEVAEQASDSRGKKLERLRKRWRAARIILLTTAIAAEFKGYDLVAFCARAVVVVGDAMLPG